MTNLGQGLADPIHEDSILDTSMDPQGDDRQQLETNQQRAISEMQEPLAMVTIAGVDSLSRGGTWFRFGSQA